MNSYDISSGSVKENLIDTNVFSQKRCEFRLPNDLNVLSNLKLLNVGCFRTGGNIQYYNRGAGICGLIKNITLMDGGNILSQCREVGKQMAFRNFNNENNVNRSIKTPNMLSASGVVYSNYDVGTFRYKGYEADEYNGYSIQVNTAEASTGKGLIVLSDLLPFLNKVEMLDTAVFKNGLKLVIEFETDRLKMTTQTSGDLTILQPILCAYEVVGMDLYEELKLGAGVMSWYEREMDQRVYSNDESVVNKFNGFDSKRLLRLFVSKEYISGAFYINNTDRVGGYGRTGSVSLLNETFNVINNGVQVFPTDINLDQMARETVNAFGNCTAYQGFNKRIGTDEGGSFPDYAVGLVDDTVVNSNLGFNGVQFNNSMVKNLEVKLGRTLSTVSTGNNDSLHVFVFGDVAKMISVGKDGSYTVGYV